MSSMNYSTAKNELGSQCENEYMLTIVPSKSSLDQTKSRSNFLQPTSSACPMNIGPLSKNHMKIFDRNFKKG